jgi:hypothetical protein
MGVDMGTIWYSTRALLHDSKKVGQEVNPQKTKYMLMSLYETACAKATNKYREYVF